MAAHSVAMVDSQESSTFTRPEALTVIQVINGGSNASFLVHEEVADEYLQTLLNGSRSNPQQIICFETEPRIFEALVHWIYHQNIDHPHFDDKLEDLIELWLLAEYLVIAKLMNFVMDKLYEGFSGHYLEPTIRAAKIVVEKTEEESPLWRLLVTAYIEWIRFEKFQSVARGLPRVFLASMTVYMRSDREELRDGNEFANSIPDRVDFEVESVSDEDENEFDENEFDENEFDDS